MPRPSLGPALVHTLPGSDDAKKKAEIVLSTLAGKPIDEAASELGMDRSYVHVLRKQVLEGAIAAAEPRKSGPKPVGLGFENLADAEAEILRLRKENAEQARALKDAEIAAELALMKEEIALVLGRRKKTAPTDDALKHQEKLAAKRKRQAQRDARKRNRG
jgi:hypothetical protein